MFKFDGGGTMKFPRLNPSSIYPTIFYGKYCIPDSTKPSTVYIRRPIEWLVLEMDEQNKRALLLSKHVIDWEGFADSPIISPSYATSWASSYLRKWLNEDFYQDSFSVEERNNICETNIIPNKETEKGTVDKIFLLSADEVKKYFVPRETAIAFEPMIMMPASGDKEDPIEIDYDPVLWWTRTLGKDTDDKLVCVDERGIFCEMGSMCDEIGVRPAMWINL